MRTRHAIALVVVMLVMASGTSVAHKGHRKRSITRPSSVVQPVAARPAGDAAGPDLHPPSQHRRPATQTPPPETEAEAQEETRESAPEVEEEETLPPFSELVFAHLHNKVIHFPIAFGLAGALFVWLAWKWKELEPAAKILWLLGALSAVAAFFSGRAQEEAFDESFLEEVVDLHEKLGITTMLALWAGFFLLYIPRLKRLAWLWALVVALLITVTAFYGGVVAHT